MNTITTKQLRENMPQVIAELKQGKPIQLSYRHKVIGVLEPVNTPGALRRGSPEAIRHGLRGLHTMPVPGSVSRDSRSIKEQIAEFRGKRRG